MMQRKPEKLNIKDEIKSRESVTKIESMQEICGKYIGT